MINQTNAQSLIKNILS